MTPRPQVPCVQLDMSVWGEDPPHRRRRSCCEGRAPSDLGPDAGNGLGVLLTHPHNARPRPSSPAQRIAWPECQRSSCPQGLCQGWGGSRPGPAHQDTPRPQRSEAKPGLGTARAPVNRDRRVGPAREAERGHRERGRQACLSSGGRRSGARREGGEMVLLTRPRAPTLPVTPTGALSTGPAQPSGSPTHLAHTTIPSHLSYRSLSPRAGCLQMGLVWWPTDLLLGGS